MYHPRAQIEIASSNYPTVHLSIEHTYPSIPKFKPAGRPGGDGIQDSKDSILKTNNPCRPLNSRIVKKNENKKLKIVAKAEE